MLGQSVKRDLISPERDDPRLYGANHRPLPSLPVTPNVTLNPKGSYMNTSNMPGLMPGIMQTPQVSNNRLQRRNRSHNVVLPAMPLVGGTPFSAMGQLGIIR